MKMFKRSILFLVCLLWIGGFTVSCSSFKGKKNESASIIPDQLRQMVERREASPSTEIKRELGVDKEHEKVPEDKSLTERQPIEFPRQKPKIKEGIQSSGPKRTSKPSISEKDSGEKQAIVFNFDKADISEVAQQIFGQYLKLNYVLDPSLKMAISLYLEGNYNKAELLNFVSEVFAAHGIDVIERNNIYYIQPFNRTTGAKARLISPEDLKNGSTLQPGLCVYRLKFLTAERAQNLIRSFLSPSRPLMADPVTNTVIFVDAMDNIRTVVDILHIMDANMLKDVGVEVIQLDHLSPKEITDAFDKVVQKINPAYKEMLSRNIVIVPLERVSSVMVVSSDAYILKTAKEWIKALDVEGQDSGEQFFVYFVKNGLAKNIVAILKEVFTGKKETSSQNLPQHAVTSEPSQTKPQATGGKTAAPTSQTTAATATSQGTSTFGAKLTGDVSIIADESNNAIVIKATPVDYAKIKKAIEAIDVLPRAVLIEMLVAEITLNDEIQYGVEWFLKNKGMKIGGYKGKYSVTQDFGTSFKKNFDIGTATSKGLSLFWGSLPGDIASLINLLSSLSHFNVLSAPTILATDNQKASITVGGSTPVVSQQSVDTTGDKLINTVQYVNTGLILNVTPHINAGGIVRMEVEQTIRDAVKNVVSGIDSPAFTERKVSTNLLAKDGSTVVIGGIIQEKSNVSRSGVPLLSKIPFISPAFSSTTRNKERTELLVAITPRVIDHAGNEASSEFLNKLKLLKAVMAEPDERREQGKELPPAPPALNQPEVKKE